MTYGETIEYLYNKLPMFSRVGSAAFKKDLTNTIALCEALHNPQQKFKSIHVGGTNGKGSVSHALAAVFGTAGYKTGLYTSPHLYDFRERIRINGEMVSKEFVVDFVHKIRPLIETIEPSFFEITVAMAFDYFAQQAVDIAIIEVGLGGRLDSTNIIRPELSIITNIGWDHMNMLGNSLQEIAFEKAGIIKESTPVVIGETLPETKPVFEQRVADVSAPALFAEDTIQVLDSEPGPDSLLLAYQTTNAVVTLTTDLSGIYQAKNVRTVLTALLVLKNQGWDLRPEIISEALAHVKSKTGLYGRWDILHRRPLVIADVAHNKEGIAEMLAHLARLTYRQLHIVFGTVKDKDPGAVLSLLPASARYYFAAAHIPRALPAADLQVKGLEQGLAGAVFDDVNEAVTAASRSAGPDDVIMICGSIFLVAEVTRPFVFQGD